MCNFYGLRFDSEAERDEALNDLKRRLMRVTEAEHRAIVDIAFNRVIAQHAEALRLLRDL